MRLGVLLFHLLWCLLHLFTDIAVCIQQLYRKFKRVLLVYRTNKPQVIARDRRHGKVPQHMSILFSNEYPSHKSIAHLIVWSILHGISYISLYDHLGQLAKNYEKLQNDVDIYLSHIKFTHHVIWHENQKYLNGFSDPKLHVKVLQPSDAHTSLIQTCQELADHEEPLSIEEVDANQRKKFEFPDPCLAIYFGDYFNLRGYPPWQMRLTEFLGLPSCKEITYKHFSSILDKYNKCEQRVGT